MVANLAAPLTCYCAQIMTKTKLHYFFFSALINSIVLTCYSVASLQLQTHGIKYRNPATVSCATSLHRQTKHNCEAARKSIVGSRLHLSANQQNDSYNGRSDDDDDDNKNDEEFINMNDFINFDEIESKLFDDLPEYGIIRSVESPHSNFEPIDPLSVDDIEFWMQKNSLRNKKQGKERMWSRFYPWVTPLTSLLLPRRHMPSSSSTESLRMKNKTSNVGMRKYTRNYNDIFSSPKLFRRFMSTPNSARNLIFWLNIIAFIYQIITAVIYLPGFNRVLASSFAGDFYSASALDNIVPQWTPLEIVFRSLGVVGGGAGVVIASGSSTRGTMGRVIGRGPIAAHSMGPFFLDYAHQPFPLSSLQKHRYLSSGFIHGSLLHLGMNMRALFSLPSWLENGIGKGVYLSAYLVGIISGNIAQTLSTIGVRAASSLCIGASGGICGLYGLMLASLMKMGNSDAVYYVVKHMMWLLLFGFMVPNVSNAGHLGGLAGGWLIGYLFGPGYERSYTLTRADGFAKDSADWEFRQMMGPGIYPNAERAILPLRSLWMVVGLAFVTNPELRVIPLALFKGVIQPGSLSGVRRLIT